MIATVATLFFVPTVFSIVHGGRKALAMTSDVTPRYVHNDAYEGGKQAVAEAYRNLCAVGARPLAITNCLNFGNPQRPEIMAQIVGCLAGMSEACIALDMPIASLDVVALLFDYVFRDASLPERMRSPWSFGSARVGMRPGRT